uniref:Pleckstrin homology domain-containing family J member 1 n=1 Tax=Cyprinus carpio carpio TaxID=630221 RepID=A0A9J7XP43_CYPCA
MRFNEKELVFLSRQPPERAAELGMRGPKKGDVVKRRVVKLIVNFLFYFRTDEDEPIGALLLEQCRVEREDDQVFSIVFLDEAERKYLFECDSQEQCVEWIDAIVKARTRWSSMGYQTKHVFRSTLVFLQLPHKHTQSSAFSGFSCVFRFFLFYSLPASITVIFYVFCELWGKCVILL